MLSVRIVSSYSNCLPIWSLSGSRLIDRQRGENNGNNPTAACMGHPRFVLSNSILWSCDIVQGHFLLIFYYKSENIAILYNISTLFKNFLKRGAILKPFNCGTRNAAEAIVSTLAQAASNMPDNITHLFVTAGAKPTMLMHHTLAMQKLSAAFPLLSPSNNPGSVGQMNDKYISYVKVPSSNIWS